MLLDPEVGSSTRVAATELATTRRESRSTAGAQEAEALSGQASNEARIPAQ